jgi:N-methylhydantoinase B
MTDFITTAVIREQLAALVREMRRSIVRSSYSSIIYEGFDFSCVLIDGRGRLVAQSGEDHPFHIIPVAASVQGLLAHIGSRAGEAIGPDDIFLHNDPYTGGTHLNDVAVVWPVMSGDAPAWFLVVRSHWADVGGTTPGSLSGGASEILHEGLRLNHLRTRKDGGGELMRLIFDNVRVSREAVADFHAVLGICRVAETRLTTILARWSAPVVAAAVDDMMDASERRMRVAIAALPQREASHTAYLDGSAATPHPLRVSVRLRILGDRVEADFTGTSDQVAAPLNAGPAIAPTSVLTILKSFLDPAGVINDGTLRPIGITIPPGTILSATNPAPCGGLNEVRFAADAAVMGALGWLVPDRMTGDVRGTSNHTYIGGWDQERGRSFIFYEYPSGGTGGSREGDGNHAVRAFNEGENVSIQSAELVEQLYPLRIIQNELSPGSGGAGQFRGGCGLVRRVAVGCDGLLLSVLSDRNIIPPAGVNGGGSGSPNRYEVLRDGAPVSLSAFPGKIAGFPLRKGDIVVMRSSGGGGFGDPARRDPALIAQDRADGIDTVAAPGHPVDITHDAALDVHHARLGTDLAEELGAAAGDLLEMTVPFGPARRVWVQSVSGTGLAVSPRLAAGPVQLHRIPAPPGLNRRTA